MNYIKWLRLIIIGGLCLLPFVSFIVASGTLFPNMFFPYITGKNFTFRILVEIITLCYIILAIKDPKYRPKASPLLWTVCLFVAWIGLATIFSVDPIKSFWSNFERMEGYITIIHLFALFVISSVVLTADRWWEKFFQVSVVVSVMQGILALFQVLHLFGFSPSSQSGARADTTFGNATYLAVYMLFCAFITIFLMMRYLGDKKYSSNSRTMLTLYSIALVLQLATLYFTETRGAILGFIGGVIIAALYIAIRAKSTEWRRMRLVSFWTIGAVAVLVVGFVAVRNLPALQHGGTLTRLASISLSDPTTQSRLLYIWPSAIKGSLERPVFGWGQENFNFLFNKYYNPEMYNQEQWFDRAHNEFLDWLVAGGVPAFLLYVSFYVIAVWLVIRSEMLSVPEQAAILGLLAANAFNSMFVFDNLISAVYFYLIFAFIHGLSQKPLPRFMFLSKPADDRVIAIVAPIAAVVVLGAGWFFNAQGIVRAQTLINALQPYTLVKTATGAVEQAARDPKENLAAYQQALTEGELGKQETVEQLLQFTSNSLGGSSSASPDVKQQGYTLALNAGNDILKERPTDSRIELFMGVFLDQFGQYDLALQHLQNALANSPDKQQILFQTGLTYLQKGDTQNALTTLKKAYDLEPKYQDARIYYAIGLYYAGQNGVADALLTQGFGTVLVDDDRIIQAYVTTKQFDRVVAIWKMRVQANPTDVQTHLGLAQAYFAQHDNADTIAELQKVSQLNVSLAPQMQQIITQIQNGTLKPQ
jgi:O-antigen ligase/lipopolysaccharide biosynthesis regulator YciM